MVGLTRAFLAAGVQCVCVSLWPVPIAASKLFTHTFYTALLNGTKASAALTEAMKTLQSSKHFSHPSNWAGELFLKKKRVHSLNRRWKQTLKSRGCFLSDSLLVASHRSGVKHEALSRFLSFHGVLLLHSLF